MNPGSKPIFKPTVARYSAGDTLYFTFGGDLMEMADDTGVVASVCDLLDGRNTAAVITSTLGPRHVAATEENVIRIIEVLDEALLIEDAATERPAELDSYDLERWSRNFDFFGAFCDSSRNKYAPQVRLKTARIGLLGLGGLGSHLLFDLAALGACDIRAVDFDRIELANLNRQLYPEAAIGQLKAEVAKALIGEFSPRLNLQIENRRLASSDDIENLIYDRDIVICVADRPTTEIVGWLNAACVKRNVPFINGGLLTTRGAFYTVIPRQTGCVECWRSAIAAEDRISSFVLQQERIRAIEPTVPMPAIIPLVSIVTGLMVAETMRILTGITPPIGTNHLLAMEFATMQLCEVEHWARVPHCKACG